MDNIHFGQLVKTKRIEHGLTQKDLGERLYVSDKAISKWERGISYPDIQKLDDLANVLDIDLMELLAYQKKEKPKISMVQRIKMHKNLLIIQLILMGCFIVLFRIMFEGEILALVEFRSLLNVIVVGIIFYIFKSKVKQNRMVHVIFELYPFLLAGIISFIYFWIRFASNYVARVNIAPLSILYALLINIIFLIFVRQRKINK